MVKSTLSRSQSGEVHHQEAVEDLLTELSFVRKEASDEFYQFLQYDKLSSLATSLSSPSGSSSSCSPAQGATAVLFKRRRLLYLFVKDLSSGVSEEVLANKTERDAMSRSLKLNCVPLEWKIGGWTLVFFMNFGMLFYVYLFAIQQTHSRQVAWFQSFVMWILFEFFVASTCLVAVVHLLIPLYVLTDLKTIKRKVLTDLTMFRDKYLQTTTGALQLAPPKTEKSFNGSLPSISIPPGDWPRGVLMFRRVVSSFNSKLCGQRKSLE
jgi:hypothetical protein